MSRVSEAKEDVQVFPEPEDLVDATDLSRSEKLDLLRQWQHDLQLLKEASEETEAAIDTGAELRTADRLTRVEAAIAALTRAANDEAAAER